MTTPVLRQRRHPRRLIAVATLLLLAFAVPAVAEPLPAVDDALSTVTCTGLLDSVDDSLSGELAALVDTSYCHTQSDTATCAPEGTTCTTEVEEDADNGSVFVNVTGTADPGGFMTLSVGNTEQTEACGEPLYVNASIRFESQGVSNLVASHKITKSLDQDFPQNGVDNIGVCYQSPKAFTDADGNTTTYGLLPMCDAVANAAPCIIERHKNKADALVKMSLPPGDPVWKMVQDTIDERTG